MLIKEQFCPFVALSTQAVILLNETSAVEACHIPILFHRSSCSSRPDKEREISLSIVGGKKVIFYGINAAALIWYNVLGRFVLWVIEYEC